MDKINNYQLFTMIVLYEVGCTPYYIFPYEVKNDAWISTLLAMILGLGLTFIYAKLSLYYPKRNLAEILMLILGKRVGLGISSLYVIYFFVFSSLLLAQFCEIISITFYQETPLYVLMFVFMFPVFYFIILGIKPIVYSSEILLPLTLFFFCFVFILLGISGHFELSNLRPVLGVGIQPIVQTTIQRIVYVPFGDMVVFLMYWKYVNDKNKIYKTSLLAVFLAGIILALTNIFLLATLDVELSSNFIVPLFAALKLINIEDIIMNLGILGHVMLFIGSVFKLLILLNASVLITATISKTKKIKGITFVYSIVLVILTIIYLPDTPYIHWMCTSILTNFIHFLFQVCIPLLVLCVHLVKYKGAVKNEK